MGGADDADAVGAAVMAAVSSLTKRQRAAWNAYGRWIGPPRCNEPITTERLLGVMALRLRNNELRAAAAREFFTSVQQAASALGVTVTVDDGALRRAAKYFTITAPTPAPKRAAGIPPEHLRQAATHLTRHHTATPGGVDSRSRSQRDDDTSLAAILLLLSTFALRITEVADNNLTACSLQRVQVADGGMELLFYKFLPKSGKAQLDGEAVVAGVGRQHQHVLEATWTALAHIEHWTPYDVADTTPVARRHAAPASARGRAVFWTASAITKRMRETMVDIGVCGRAAASELTARGARSGTATALRDAGVSPAAVKRVAGWASDKSVSVYDRHHAAREIESALAVRGVAQ